MVTDQTGAVQASHDYYPYGAEVGGGSGQPRSPAWGTTDYLSQKYTGQERDAESGLDHYPARHFASTMGRFMKPDPVGNFVARVTNPQSWNMYSYGLNNPAAYVDPSGLCSVKATNSDGLDNTSGVATDDPGSPCVDPGQTSISVNDTAWQLSYDWSDSLGFSDPSGGGSTGAALGAQGTPTQSWWGCVRGDTDALSLQSGLKSLTGGRLGGGWLAGAFLGNSVQAVGDTVKAVASFNFVEAANASGSEIFGDTAGSVAKALASKVPDVGLAVGVQASLAILTPTSSTSLSVIAQASARVPLGALATAGADLLDGALSVLSLVKLPYDGTVAAFSGLVCGLGR